MKKIFIALISLLFAVACHDDRLQTDPNTEGGTVTLTVSMQMAELAQPSTRALGEFDINNAASLPLQLVVFDSYGLLTEVKTATYQKTEGDEVYFSVNLVDAPERRIVHLLLNASIPADTYGTEADLIGRLSVGDGTPAYWQRVELPMIADNDQVKALLKRVPMIRNHAKISVTNKDTKNFEFTGYTVVNVPSKGTVAPYNLDANDGGFAIFNDGERPRSYFDITRQGYEGIQPTDAILLQTTTDLNEPTRFLAADDAYYMYERRNTFISIDMPTTYLIIEGIYEGKKNYYKLDFVYYNESQMLQYYNILRNFHYAVSIDAVNGKGYDSPQEAARHAAGNNLTGSIDLRDLTNISDGIDRLFVSYTDTTVTSTGTIQVKYRFLDADAETGYNNTDVEIQRPMRDQYIGTVIRNEEDGKAVVDANGWTTVSIDVDNLPNDLSVHTYTFHFLVYKTLADGTIVPYLSREVDVHLRRELNMIVECAPRRVPEGTNQQVTANILIPVGLTGESDPYQLFPLEFLVEAEEMTLYPDVAKNEANIHQASPKEMPVRTGASIVPGVTDNTFRYLRTVSNDEYQSLPTKDVSVTLANGTVVTGTYKVIPCCFKTNTKVSATKVYAQNKYFTLIKEGAFINAASVVLNAALTNTPAYYHTGKPVRLTFTAAEDGTYTVTSPNLNAETTTTVALNAGQSYEVDFTTTTWRETPKAIVTYEDGDYLEVAGSAPNILAMKAMKATLRTGVELTENPTLRVYDSFDKNNPNASTNVLATPTKYELLNNWTEMQYDNLSDSQELWFVYESNDYIYYASAAAKDLADGTAQLVFDKVAKPLEITRLALEGEQYYGAGRTVTLTFETNKTGTYTIEFTEGSNSETVVFTVTDITEAVSVDYKTKTWSDKVSAKVVYTDGSTESITGNERNRLLIKTRYGYNYNTTFKISTQKIDRYSSWTNATSAQGYLTNGIEFEIDNLNQDITYYLAYRTGNGNNRVYYNVSMKAEDFAKEDVSLNFSR